MGTPGCYSSQTTKGESFKFLSLLLGSHNNVCMSIACSRVSIISRPASRSEFRKISLFCFFLAGYLCLEQLMLLRFDHKPSDILLEMMEVGHEKKIVFKGNNLHQFFCLAPSLSVVRLATSIVSSVFHY